MTQGELFHDLTRERLAAYVADVEACGGYQAVGHAIGLHEDPITAGRLLANKLNPRQTKHHLGDATAFAIKQLAQRKRGRSFAFEFDAQHLNFEGRWLTSQDVKERRKKRIKDTLAQLHTLMTEDAEEDER